MLDYKSSGVDTEKAQEYIKSLKETIVGTHKKAKFGSVQDQFGGFAGIFRPGASFAGADIVAATDGVGTKIELARRFGFYDCLGQDLVAMCANDLYCTGATPLFFLDYVACGRLNESWYVPVIESISKACLDTGMALLGGESAEHPGVMGDDEFDLAGFCVGMIQPGEALPKISDVVEGDLLFSAASSGLHSNGFSLVRKIIAELEKNDPEKWSSLKNDSEWIKEKLLAPTRLYTFLPELVKQVPIKAISHITGGGIYENLERVLPESLSALVEKPEPHPLAIMDLFRPYVKEKDLYKTFNMGTGLVAVLPKETSQDQIDLLASHSFVLSGRVVSRESVSGASVILEGIDR